jgi:HEAT repeat protein
MRFLIWTLALLGPPAAAVAAPIRMVPAAGGAIDLRDGDAPIAQVVLKTPPLRRGPAAVREVTVDGHRLVELRIPIRGTAAAEVWIGEVGGRGKGALWSGIAGPRDADAETAVGVELTAEHLLEYQTAAGVTRCDGIAPRLFPRVYDFDSGRFRPVLSPLPPAGIETLAARRGDPAMPAGRPLGGFHWVAASSTRAAGSDARALGAPVELNDADVATAWTEGLGGDGRGEFLTAHATATGYAIRGLRIFPGDGSSVDAFRAKNRVRRFQLAFGPAREQRFDVEIPGDPAADSARWRDAYWVPLPKPIVSSCVTVVVTDVTPGKEAAPPKSFGTTAIGELSLFTELDTPQGAERLVADLASSADCATRLPLVVSLGRPALLPAAQAVLSTKGHQRECLVEALTALEPAPESPVVLEALTAAVAGASEKEERLVTAALMRAKTVPVSALAQLLAAPKAAVDDRARAARVLGALDDAAAAEALFAAVGQGPPQVRAAVVMALGQARGARLDTLLAAVAAGPRDGGQREADLVRALPGLVNRNPERRADAVTALRTAALAPERGFEVRARAVMALGAMGGRGDPTALVEVRAKSDDAVLRYLATRELAGLVPAGGIDSRPALRAALADVDPRVRETAALALGKQGDKGAADALMTGAKQEPWPFVRRAEIEALGQLCTTGTGELLLRAVERDVDEVRRVALVGLVRCKDARTRTVLIKTLTRENEGATVRELAAALIGETGDRAAAPQLATALARLVTESEADLALEGVAATALRALARLGGPEAVGAAVTLATDKRHPFRSTAVEALGVLCDPVAGRATLRAIAAGNEPSLALAALNAEKHCGSR